MKVETKRKIKRFFRICLCRILRLVFGYFLCPKEYRRKVHADFIRAFEAVGLMAVTITFFSVLFILSV